MIQLHTPKEKEELSLLTEVQLAFIKNEDRTYGHEGDFFDYLNLTRQGEDYSHPAPVLFSWEDIKAPSYTLEIATKDDFPRNIWIPDLTNIRDFGGQKNKDGKRIRQGLL